LRIPQAVLQPPLLFKQVHFLLILPEYFFCFAAVEYLFTACKELPIASEAVAKGYQIHF
jgi:hypothetical protein